MVPNFPHCKTMIRHTLSTPFVKQCSRGAASISSSTTTASKGIIITASSTTTLNDAQITRTTESRGACCFFSTTNNNRTFSSLPHHLARKNNGMVNVLVKSTKVPRPTMMIPVPKKQQQQKVNNKNPYLKDQKKIVSVLEETMEDDENSHLSYVGSQKLPITSELKIVLPEEDVPRGIWPVFRMMVRCYS